ncbi:MAG: hypothetical protein LBC61_05265 [Candidatus Peribacteria bacterium]|jgi:hypothetical protein|nr:hypothetical protein [Candidatus Peribacteria bacterium]
MLFSGILSKEFRKNSVKSSSKILFSKSIIINFFSHKKLAENIFKAKELLVIFSGSFMCTKLKSPYFEINWFFHFIVASFTKNSEFHIKI